MCLCVCVSLCVCVCVYICVFVFLCVWRLLATTVGGWRSEDDKQGSTLSFQHMGIESGGQQSLVSRTLNYCAVLQSRIFYVRNESLFNFLFPYIFSYPVLLGEFQVVWNNDFSFIALIFSIDFSFSVALIFILSGFLFHI